MTEIGCRPQAKKKFHYDPTVSLGNILSALGLVVAVVFFAVRLEGRVEGVEKDLLSIDRLHDLRLSALEKRMDREYTDIKHSLTRIENRLDIGTNGGKR